MYKNYYFLNRYIIELKPYLIGKSISEIFSQEKDKIVFKLGHDNEQFIEISVNPALPYLSLKNKYHRAKRNTLSFFSQIKDSIINDILIASDDRIILISTNKGNIYFAIRGKNTNVFVISNHAIDSFKKTEKETLFKYSNEFQDKVYINHFNLLNKDELNGKSIEQIRNDFPFVGKEIENEIKLRSERQFVDGDLLQDVLRIIQNNEFVVYLDNQINDYNIGFTGLLISKGTNTETFNDGARAFNSFLILKYHYRQKLNKIKLINSFIQKELGKTSNKLNRLISILEKGPEFDSLNKIAEILLINLNKIEPRKSSIELEDIYNNNEQIKIKLDPKLNPNQNINYYFTKAKDNKIKYEKSIVLKKETEKYFQKLKSIEQQLKDNKSIDELDVIMKELKIKPVNDVYKSENITIKFKQYLIEDKYNVYVGKDSSNNDLLTTKFAKQNDYWFHARSVPGSHVVLRVENSKEAIPKNILKKVASIAAFHSKAKTSGLVPVTFTLKKYVVKRKGMPIGQVSLLKEEVLLVKPEIPKGCEFIAAD